MKFKLLNFNLVNGRLGYIDEIERLPSFYYETPNVLFYTKGGCIPHLTYEVMQMLSTKILPLQFPLTNYFHNHESIVKSNASLSSFVGLPEYFSYCFTHDPTFKVPQKLHRGKTATVWSRNGKHYMPAEEYMELMESFKPDLYVSMNDGDTDQQCSQKRCYNAASITNDALKYCFNKHISSPILKNKGFIAPIEGGYDLDLRERCAVYVASFPVFGYLISGLYSNGKIVCNMPFQPVEHVLNHTLKFLPQDRVRIVHGAFEPISLLKMVKLGIDLFDTSLPYLLTEEGRALSFNYDIEKILFDDDENKITESNKYNYDYSMILDRNSKETSENSKDNFSIYLQDKKYFDDFNSLVQNCNCLTCKQHTRAYIHHLLCVDELLAYVVLMIHNLHYYMEFFNKIRNSLRNREMKSEVSVMT